MKQNDVKFQNKRVGRKGGHTILYIPHNSNSEKVLALKIYQNVNSSYLMVIRINQVL